MLQRETIVTVTQKEIERWAECYAAKGEFPRLLRSLIAASGLQILKLEMAGGEKVYVSGVDGLTEVIDGNDFIPNGRAIWELGTEKNVTSKANSDFDKRSVDISIMNKGDTAFVFATPCKWSSRLKWIAEKQQSRIWRDIRGLSSTELEAWFDLLPWIGLAFRRHCLGEDYVGVRTLDMLWEEYSVPRVSGSPLSVDFVLGGRVGISTQVARWLTSSQAPGVLQLTGSSNRELLDFVVASIQQLNPESVNQLSATLFAIDRRDSSSCLTRVKPSNIVIAASPDVVSGVMHTVNRVNCRAILLKGSKTSPLVTNPNYPSIHLNNMTREQQIRLVCSVGFDAERAALICKKCNFDYEQIRMEIFQC